MVSIDQQIELIKRGSVELINEAELRKKLSQNRPLRIKAGFDPTAADLHLGHTVLIQKLKQFQELGHHILFLIGDFTASIGDPSGRNETRPPLSAEDIQKNATTYQEQVFKILDPQKTEVVYNSKWLGTLGLKEVIQLASKYTVARMLERNDFEKRYQDNIPISIHEFLYPLLQGYDSVALKADIELGGFDQKFNLLMGRHLQEIEKQAPQVVLMMPLLEGLQGVQKMSKSLGNYVGITEAPEIIFNKLMSISDELMWKYYELLSALVLKDIAKLKGQCHLGELNPKIAKMQLAQEIVARFHGKEAGEQAWQSFEKSFSQQEYEVLPAQSIQLDADRIALYKLVKDLGFATSGNEAKAKIQGGAIIINDEVIKDPLYEILKSLGKIEIKGKLNKKRVKLVIQLQ